jgi:hypothetical protein
MGGAFGLDRRSVRRVVLPVAAGLAVCGCLAVLLAACGGDDENDDAGLGALRREKIATAAVPGTAAGETREIPGGTALGKPVRAILTRALPVLPDGDPDEALAAAVDTAKRDGWAVESPPARGGAWLLTKTVDADVVRLDASVQTLDGSPALVLNLVDTGAAP